VNHLSSAANLSLPLPLTNYFSFLPQSMSSPHSWSSRGASPLSKVNKDAAALFRAFSFPQERHRFCAYSSDTKRATRWSTHQKMFLKKIARIPPLPQYRRTHEIMELSLLIAVQRTHFSPLFLSFSKL
jgi:hypothetical protein